MISGCLAHKILIIILIREELIMELFDWYVAVLKKYTVFDRRARRKEFWMFYLGNVIINVVLNALIRIIPFLSVLSMLYSLAILIPGIAVGIRRMHDIGKSGWFILIPIYNIVLAATEGTRGDNQYGPDPKADSDADQIQ